MTILKRDYTFLFFRQLQIPKPTRIHLKLIYSVFIGRKQSGKVWPTEQLGLFFYRRIGLVFIFLAAGPANMIQWRSYLISQRNAT